MLSVSRLTDRQGVAEGNRRAAPAAGHAAEARNLDALPAAGVRPAQLAGRRQGLRPGRRAGAVRERVWPDAQFGQCCLLARRLAEAGVPMINVHYCHTPDGSWDTHSKHFSQMKQSLCPTFDQAFAALVADLDQRGLLGQTLVLANAEFGRTPKINSSAGRDHWPWVYSHRPGRRRHRGGRRVRLVRQDGRLSDRQSPRSQRPGGHRLPSPGRRPGHPRSRPDVPASSPGNRTADCGLAGLTMFSGRGPSRGHRAFPGMRAQLSKQVVVDASVDVTSAPGATTQTYFGVSDRSAKVCSAASNTGAARAWTALFASSPARTRINRLARTGRMPPTPAPGWSCPPSASLPAWFRRRPPAWESAHGPVPTPCCVRVRGRRPVAQPQRLHGSHVLLAPEMAVEQHHQRYRRLVVHLPQTGGDVACVSDVQGVDQAVDAFAAGRLAQTRLAGLEPR